MKKYRNTKTGAVIETRCEIAGENWEEISSPKGKKDKKGTEVTAEEAKEDE